MSRKTPYSLQRLTVGPWQCQELLEEPLERNRVAVLCTPAERESQSESECLKRSNFNRQEPSISRLTSLETPKPSHVLHSIPHED